MLMNDPPSKAAWAKAKAKDEGLYHPLICHATDTAVVARRIFPLLLGPHIRNELENAFKPLGNSLSWVATLCGLHDIGKYSATFQSLNFKLSSELLGEWALEDLEMVCKPEGRLNVRVDTPHGLLTMLHMQDLLQIWGATTENANRIATVLGGHHGCFPSSEVFRQARAQSNNHGGVKWARWRNELVSELLRLLGLPEPQTLQWQDVQLSTSAALGLAALTTVSDWIASDTSNFPYFKGDSDLGVYLESAKGLAEIAVDKVGMQPWMPPKDAGFSSLFPDVEARPVQALVEQLTSDLTEPTLLLVEAPTGEGKSKTALQAASATVRQLGLAGFYIGMPTQATGNQILTVTKEMLKDLADSSPVSLVHSNAKDFLDNRLTNPSEVGIDEEQGLAAPAWIMLNRNLLGSLGVGTVDRSLKGALRLKHFFVRLSALSNKVLVIDEVHAYDLYMSTLLERLLMWLGSVGTPVILLSATLSSGRRCKLIAAWQAGRRGCSLDEVPLLSASNFYPRVTLATANTVDVHTADISKLNEDRTIHLELVKDEQIVDWLFDHAIAGRSVAVVHNLVKRAISTHDLLKKKFNELPVEERPLLYAINGTVTAGKRREIEDDLQSMFGEDGTRPSAVIVGTQVLEHGLDLDFDIMLSDFASIDLLIQRAGRIHRHDRSEIRGPQILGITGVIDTPTGPMFPPHLKNIYPPIVLMRTWVLLKDKESIASPGEISVLVDSVYEETIDCPKGWEELWIKECQHLESIRDRDEVAVAARYLPLPDAVEYLSELNERPKAVQTRRNKGKRR